MLKCKEIARLLSSGEDLSWMKKAELSMHLAMCKHCAKYAGQLKVITRSARQLFKATPPSQLNELEKKIIRDNSSRKNGN